MYSKLIKPILSFIVFSNLFIAVCASSLVGCVYILVGIDLELTNSIGLIFCSTLALYNLLRIAAIIEKKISSGSMMIDWIQSHKFVNVSLIVLGLIGSAYFFIQIGFYAKLVFALAGIITALYKVPYVKAFNLRAVPYLKTIIVAISWALLIGLMPIVENIGSFDLGYTWIMPLAIFLFIVSITIPFDIRDLKYDKAYNLKTIPASIGVMGTKRLSVILLGTACVSIMLMNVLLFNSMNYTYAIFAFGLIVGILIMQTNEKRGEFWYTFLIDSTMILLFTSLFIADKFS